MPMVLSSSFAGVAGKPPGMSEGVSRGSFSSWVDCSKVSALRVLS